MKLRLAAQRKRATAHGPVERLVTFLSLHGFTAFDALMLPFLLLFAAIMIATPTARIEASPTYGKLTDLAPIWTWALALITVAVIISLSMIRQTWGSARVAYTMVAFWWFAVGGLVYLAATTLLSPAVYFLIGIACLYRQAEIAVGYGDGGD